jgi:hypothetical protein
MPSFTETTDRHGWTEHVTADGWTIRSRERSNEGRHGLYNVTVISPDRQRVVKSDKVTEERLTELRFFPEHAWAWAGR